MSPNIVWEINLTTVAVVVGWVVSIGTGILAFQRLGDRTKEAQETAGTAKTLVNALEERMNAKLDKLDETWRGLLSATHNNCTETAADIRRDYLPRKEFEDFNRRHADTMREMRQESSDGRKEILASVERLDDRLLTFIRNGKSHG